ncbi:hypothetical protein BpHYR1_043705 [Brachionus plicatilis]|uniref:Uncharacterized protein n=1 Tax=Brachionus plicatilis TaxID=10195 RepID=A0A3M7T4T0_BRAPC|nr:hypothetical protein BpHYR1_043705 [Brachionus plicatilis]
MSHSFLYYLTFAICFTFSFLFQKKCSILKKFNGIKILQNTLQFSPICLKLISFTLNNKKISKIIFLSNWSGKQIQNRISNTFFVSLTLFSEFK